MYMYFKDAIYKKNMSFNEKMLIMSAFIQNS